MKKSKNKAEKKNTVHHANDGFFKQFMSDPIRANDLFTIVLPKEIYKRVDPLSLVLCPQSFVDNKLKHKHVDVLYQVKFDDAVGYIYILTEQQTEPDETMPFRIMQYILRIIEHHQKQFNTKSFPVIYPLIFYVGKRPYNFSTDFYDGFGANKELAKSILTSPFQVTSVTATKEEDLHDHPLSGALFKIYQMVAIRDFVAQLSELKPYIVYIESRGYSDLVVSMLELVLNKAENADDNAIIEAVTQMVSKETGEKIMTAAEKLRQDAAQSAMQRQAHTIASNLLREHIDIVVVAKTTHLSLEELKKLKKAIEDTKH